MVISSLGRLNFSGHSFGSAILQLDACVTHLTPQGKKIGELGWAREATPLHSVYAPASLCTRANDPMFRIYMCSPSDCQPTYYWRAHCINDGCLKVRQQRRHNIAGDRCALQRHSELHKESVSKGIRM